MLGFPVIWTSAVGTGKSVGRGWTKQPPDSGTRRGFLSPLSTSAGLLADSDVRGGLTIPDF